MEDDIICEKAIEILNPGRLYFALKAMRTSPVKISFDMGDLNDHSLLTHLNAVIYKLAGKDGLARTGRPGDGVYCPFVKTAINQFVISRYA